MKNIFRFVGLLFFAASAGACIAQDADEIINDYFKACGGKDKIAAITTIKMVGETQSPRGNAPMTMIKKAPNKNKLIVSPMGTDMTMAYDGETAWMINPWAGGAPKILEGDEAKSIPQDEIENPLINYTEKGHAVKYLGEEDVADVTHAKVRLTKKGGDEVIYYFSSDTDLLTQIKMLVPDGKAKGSIMGVIFEDYKDVGGILMPHISDRQVDGVSVGKFIVAEIVVNSVISDDEFSFPKE